MSVFRKSRIISILTTAFFQLASYWCISEFLQTQLNKLFKSDFYVIIIGALLIVAPIFVYIKCNLFFYGDNAKKSIINIIFTSIIFIIIIAVCYFGFLPYDDDFAFLGLTIHTLYIIILSAIFIIFYRGNLDKNK